MSEDDVDDDDRIASKSINSVASAIVYFVPYTYQVFENVLDFLTSQREN